MKQRPTILRVALAYALLALALAACSDPLDTIVPMDQRNWDAELSPQLAKLSSEDLADMRKFLERARHSSRLIKPGMTVREALAWERDLRVRLEAEREAKREEEVRRAEALARAMALVIPADPATWEADLLPSIIALKNEYLLADVQAYLSRIAADDAPAGITVCEALWKQFDVNKQAELEQDGKRGMQLFWEAREEVKAMTTCPRPGISNESEKAQ